MMRKSGFTLIELMIVVSIIGILASIALPKFANLLRKTKEGAAKGSLGNFRSAISIYYSNNEGWYPSGSMATNSSVLSTALVPKYMTKFPTLDMGKYHPPGTSVYLHYMLGAGDFHDSYGWGYDGYLPVDRLWGSLWIFCSHTDTKGSSWSTY